MFLTEEIEKTPSPSLVSLCVSCIASGLYATPRDSSSSIDQLVAQLDAHLPNELLLLIAHQVLKRSDYETFKLVASQSPRIADLAMLKALKKRQERDCILREQHMRTMTSEDCGRHLISIFDEMSTFVYSPRGSWEEDCGGILFPQHATNRPVGSPSVVSKAQFEKNFAIFTRDQFKHIDMSNLVIIGGAVCACATPIPAEYEGREEEYYERAGWGESDIDVCFIGEKSDSGVMEFYESLKKSHPEVPVTVISTVEAITFSRHYPFRSIQIMGHFKHILDAISDIDIDCTAMAYDGNNKKLWGLERSRFALNTRMNVVDEHLYGVRGAPNYEKRLLKYETRQFSILDIGLKKDAVDPSVLLEPDKEVWSFVWQGPQSGTRSKPGFGRKLLLLSEKYPWVKERLLGMKMSIPYGPTVDAQKLTQVLSENKASSLDANHVAYNCFDGYTCWYRPPQVINPSDLKGAIQRLRLSSNHDPFLVPQWDVDMVPNWDYEMSTGEEFPLEWEEELEEEDE